ncbi:MAG: tail fiber domain-containing protein [Flavobacteriaceae bacterium]
MKKFVLLSLMAFFCLKINAQVGINTTTPDPSSELDISSTDGGILIPRMTQVERDAIASPATGLMIYQTNNTPGFYYYDGATWQGINGSSDADWYEIGTSAAPNSINDHQYSLGKVSMGLSTLPSATLRVFNNDPNDRAGLRVERELTAAGTGGKYGLEVQMDVSSTNNYAGIVSSYLGSTTTAPSSAFSSNMNSTTLNGDFNIFESTLLSASGTGNIKGLNISYLSSNTNTGDKYGGDFYIDSGLSGIHYGVRSRVLNSSGYAGYFAGRVQLGESLTTGRYFMPAADGTAGQVMATDGSGNLSFQNAGVDTDDQTIDVFSLTGTTLNLSLQDDGQPTQTVDLSSLQDGTGTDDQTIDVFGLAGTLLGISLENDGQPTQTVDLSSLQDGTGTDDQTIDAFGLAGTILGLSLESDGQPLQTVDLSSLQDGTGTDDQTIDAFNLVGTTLNLSLESDGQPNQTVDLSSLAVKNTLDEAYDEGGPGAGRTINAENGAVFINRNTDAAGSGLEISLNSLYTLSQRSAIKTFNAYPGLETYNNIYRTGGPPFGEGFLVTNAASSIINGKDGVVVEFNQTATTNFGNDNRGFLYNVTYNGGPSASLYGFKAEIEGSGTAPKYGLHVAIPTSSGGIKFGVYSDVQNTTNGFAGYFIGRSSFGTGTANRYLMPSVDGTAGQVMTTDGAGNVTFQDAAGSDADWYQEGTSNAPSNNTDDIYTEGNVGIGTSTVTYPLDISTTTATRTIDLLNENNGSSATGIYNRINESSISSNGITNGITNLITKTNQSTISGVSNSFQNSDATNSFGYLFGYENSFGTSTALSTFAMINRFQGTTTTAYGISNLIGGPMTTYYGLDNHTIAGGAISNNFFGVYNELSGSSSGFRYGVYTSFTETGSGNKFGEYINIASTAGGTHYGIYSDVQKATGYAAFLVGRTSLGNAITNRYLMPGADGTAGQVITTDGAGNLSWTTASGESTTASNGLSETGNDVRLGGTLIQATTIAQGNFGMTYNLTGTGDFAVQDNGSPAFIVEDTGDVGFGLTNPAYQVDIEETDNTKFIGARIVKTDNTATLNTAGLQIDKTTNGSGSANGILQNIAGTGTGEKRGIYNVVSTTGTGNKKGVLNTFTATASGLQYGVENQFDGATVSPQRGLVNNFSSGTNSQFGLYNVFTGTATSGEYGAYSIFNNSSTSSKVANVGIFGTAADGNHTGAEYTFDGTTNTTKKGFYANFGNSTVGTLYGLHVNMSNSDSGTKYGVFVNLANTVTGTANYGIFSNVNIADGWAGYFTGKNYVSESIGINNPSPDGRLDIIHNSSGVSPHIMLTAENANTGARIIMDNDVETTNNWVLFGRADDTSTDSRFNVFHTGTGNIMIVTGDGKVGINRTPVTNALEVAGDASKTTAGSWAANSDRRLKKDIESIEGKTALEKIERMRGVTYLWNDTQTGIKRPENLQYGFIAQELMEVFPEKVTQDNLGFYQTAYGDYDPLFVEAIKELKKEVETLSEENQQLKAQLSQYQTLEARLAALENKAVNNDIKAELISAEKE